MGECRAGDAGRKSTRMRQVKFKSHGLSELGTVGAGNPAGCNIQGTVEGRDPARTAILFHYWTPESVHAGCDIAPVEEQARAEGRENVNLHKENWLEAPNCTCVSNGASIDVANSRSLETRNPPIAGSLSQMKLDPAVVKEWTP